MNLLKGIVKGIKASVTGHGIKSMIPFAERGLETLEAIKTDPVKRWENIGKLGVFFVLSAGLIYLLGKGILSVDQVIELLEALN